MPRASNAEICIAGVGRDVGNCIRLFLHAYSSLLVSVLIIMAEWYEFRLEMTVPSPHACVQWLIDFGRSRFMHDMELSSVCFLVRTCWSLCGIWLIIGIKFTGHKVQK